MENTDSTIENEVVLRHSDHLVFWCLTVLSSIATLWLIIIWIWALDWGRHPIILSGVTGVGAILVSLNQASWFILLYMKRPRWIPAREDWRVAVVTTIVPTVESVDMLTTTLEALVGLEYPHDTWVLDEDNDPGVQQQCERLGVKHFSRKSLPQYQTEEGIFKSRSKHGNYNSWLCETGYKEYDILVAFDPDHVPHNSFLMRVLGYFNDPTVAYVQAPQVYYNQDASFIARGAAEESYEYYSYVQMGSYGRGYPVLIGCHNTHLLEALRQVGGFAAHDADDLLTTLSYRSSSWQGVYVPEILAQGLTPVDWPSYIAQQRRWARAILDIKFRHYPRIAAQLPWPTRVIALLQGTDYFHRSLLILFSLILLIAMLALGTAPSIHGVSLPLAGSCTVLLLCRIFQRRFYLDKDAKTGWHWRALVLEFAKWPFVLGEVFELIRGARRDYFVTPKTRSTLPKQILLLPNVLIITAVTAAWIIGAISGDAENGYLFGLYGAAGLTIAGSLALIATEHIKFPAPYDPTRRPTFDRQNR